MELELQIFVSSLSYGHWELTRGPMQEQQALLNTEPSLLLSSYILVGMSGFEYVKKYDEIISGSVALAIYF